MARARGQGGLAGGLDRNGATPPPGRAGWGDGRRDSHPAWEVAGGALLPESHLEPLAQRAPAGTRLESRRRVLARPSRRRGPEGVALFRAQGGIPSRMVLESRGSDFRVTPSVPLVSAAALGLEDWESGWSRSGPPAGGDARRRPLACCSTCLRTPICARWGCSGPDPDGGLKPLIISGDGEVRPAIFYDGIFGDVTSQLGLVDLDENTDGSLEIVIACRSRRHPRWSPGSSGPWRPSRARPDGRLVAAPELRESALETIRRAAGVAEASSGSVLAIAVVASARSPSRSCAWCASRWARSPRRWTISRGGFPQARWSGPSASPNKCFAAAG